MRLSQTIKIGLFSLLVLFVSIAYAAIDPSAKVVTLDVNCSDGNGGALNNCFTSLNSLTGWLSTTRKPNSSSPLRVDMGPGTFTGVLNLVCDPSRGYTGYISFNGSGRQQTTISGDQYISPISVSACTELNFSSFTVNGTLYGGVQWDGNPPAFSGTQK